MLNSEAEHFVRRSMEETGAQFSEEQIKALAYMIAKISGRLVEEAVSSLQAGNQGARRFFAD